MRLSLTAAASIALRTGLPAAPTLNPEFCAPTVIPGAPMANQPESTRKMAALLAKLATEGSPFDNPYRTTELVPILRQALQETSDPEKMHGIELPYAEALLASGDSAAALVQYENFERGLDPAKQPMTSRVFTILQTAKAVAELRIGEQENCLVGHNADSCLFPIRGGGIHQLPRGSRAAIGTLTALLEKFPGDLRARWLLNIAAMTLGEYPDKVPPQWRIDPKVFASGYDLHRFPDVAGALRLDVDDLAGGVVMDDFDRDGCLDLMTSSWRADGQLRFFHNNGDGSFTERTAESGLLGEVGGLNLIQADYNSDGFVDVLVLRGAWAGPDGHIPNSLLRNNGDGTFTDVTEEAGLLSFHPTQAAVWFDYDGDGHVDLFIGNESTPQQNEINPCELYRNNGNGTFTECASASGVAAVGFVKGVVSGDFNNDGRPDLFLSRRDGRGMLFRNDGPAAVASTPTAWRFTDVAQQAGVTEPFQSFACWFFDYDNDGWLDLFVSGYGIQDVGDVAADYLGLPQAGQRARLFRNRGDGTFADVTKEAGLFHVLHTMGCNFGDLDNDGWLDFYVGTGDPDYSTLLPNRMFRNDGRGHFQDVTTSGGFGQLQKGHGIAFGDIDNDGDQDIYAVLGGALAGDNYRNQLFANPGHGNHWLKLKLEGVKANRDALGARIKVIVKTPSGERTLYRTVGSGANFGASSFRQEIGLGDATAIVSTEIMWPGSGTKQTVAGLVPDRAYEIREGSTNAVALNLRHFLLPAAPAAVQSTYAVSR